MFFQFLAQEINIAKDILVKPALSEVEWDGSSTAILAVEKQPGWLWHYN